MEQEEETTTTRRRKPLTLLTYMTQYVRGLAFQLLYFSNRQ